MSETIILGGGCFWCTESVFQSLKGVLNVEPGYSGGHVEHPRYEEVCRGNTGHIEVVRVQFDPDQLPLESLLTVFFATHDPTTPDRQGADVGPQYASAIFYESPAQRDTAQKVIKRVEQWREHPVVTHLREAEQFWPAEGYHQNYYRNNPHQGYCQAVIVPKLSTLRRHFSSLLNEQPDG